MQTSSQIRAIESDEEAADKSIEEFTDLYNKIIALPDADHRISRAKQFLTYLSTDPHVVADDLQEAAEKISDAFATITEWREYIPMNLYVPLEDAMTNLYARSMWDTEPRLMRKVMPRMLEDIFERKQEIEEGK